jgi:hypothetical protein
MQNESLGARTHLSFISFHDLIVFHHDCQQYGVQGSAVQGLEAVRLGEVHPGDWDDQIRSPAGQVIKAQRFCKGPRKVLNKTRSNNVKSLLIIKHHIATRKRNRSLCLTVHVPTSKKITWRWQFWKLPPTIWMFLVHVLCLLNCKGLLGYDHSAAGKALLIQLNSREG